MIVLLLICKSDNSFNGSFSLDDSLLTHHDRYIVIDNKMEIILSSGFMYLELTGKELTYVVRPVQENRLLVNG